MQVVREHRDDLIGRVRVLTAVATGLLVAIATGFWFVQLVQGDYYRELAENNRLRKLPIKAPRGLIYDRKGRLLVENVPSYNLMLDRSRAEHLDRSLAFAAEVLELPLDELQALMETYRPIPEFKPVLLAENLTLSQVARFGVESLEYPEFEVEVQHLRLYRHRQQTAHLLGYLGEATEEEIAASRGAYQPGDLVGKKGIEQTYDAILRGADGERVVVVDSRGELLREYGSNPAVPGRNLKLSIDLDLQQEAARWLDGPEKVGAVIAMDPRNGEILALVSSPSYNPNIFARRLQRADWQALVDDPNHPLQNRAIQNTYSPGSTFKIVMETAGLTEAVFNEHTAVGCSGAKSFYGRPFRCWRVGGHGMVNAHSALKLSCDVYFYTLGQKMGIERIARYARLFGLGSPTGIDLSGEKRGLVPDPDWSLAARKHPWYPGETISVSIGQGPVLLTPLQMAEMTALVANGGYRVIPHLVKDARMPPPKRVALDDEALRAVRGGMWAVVNEPGGTAYGSARLPGVEIAGKSGTVQVIAYAQRIRPESMPFKYRDHAWFTSFAPAENPELVVTVFAEHGGGGSRVAAPIAQAVYAKYFGIDYGKPPAP
ncbi:MAG TPA: penicillin-binding protein 2 [Thermoanaerobaculia bacterium]|jgi:penicillin-binding protein 2|nr:penicillin-binding protein 2 [Thermoanaerobaculia bacterium]